MCSVVVQCECAVWWYSVNVQCGDGEGGRVRRG